MTVTIRNDEQYRVAKEEIGKFRIAIAQLDEDKAGLHPNYYLAMRGALESQCEELEEQVSLFDKEIAIQGQQSLLDHSPAGGKVKIHIDEVRDAVRRMRTVEAEYEHALEELQRVARLVESWQGESAAAESMRQSYYQTMHMQRAIIDAIKSYEEILSKVVASLAATDSADL